MTLSAPLMAFMSVTDLELRLDYEGTFEDISIGILESVETLAGGLERLSIETSGHSFLCDGPL